MAILREWAGALAFLTRLPVPGLDASIPLHRLTAWFPAVGLVVGGLVGGVYWLAMALGMPPKGAAWVVIVVEMLVTGALHPDGLADTADGLAAATPERRLAIMKDPRIGAFGGIALVLTLGGRSVLLMGPPGAQVVSTLVLAHAAARWAPVWALARHPYARPGGGTGAAFSGAGWRELGIATATVVSTAWLLHGTQGLAALVLALMAGVGATAYITRKLGGITGDVCGAVTEVSLLACLLALALRWPL